MDSKRKKKREEGIYMLCWSKYINFDEVYINGEEELIEVGDNLKKRIFQQKLPENQEKQWR